MVSIDIDIEEDVKINLLDARQKYTTELHKHSSSL
jgi:hypothetical protein